MLAQYQWDQLNETQRLELLARPRLRNNREQTEQERQRIQSIVQELASTLANLQQEYDSQQANLSASQQAAAEANRLLKSFKHENLPPIGLPA